MYIFYSHVLVCIYFFANKTHMIFYTLINTHMICIYIVCTKCFSKIKCQVFNFFFSFKTLTLELKLKWDTILWIGGVGCLTPSSPKTEPPNPKSLVQDIGLP